MTPEERDRSQSDSGDASGSSESGQIRPVDAAIVELERLIRSGRTPNLEEIRARYSDCAAELETYLRDQDALLRSIREGSGALPSQAREPEPSIAPGVKLGEYHILAEIGRGGMGVVYKALQSRPERTVALKVLLGGRQATLTDRKRFRREAETSAALERQNIVPIFDVGEVDDQPYFTMPLLEGGSLRERLAHQRLEPIATAKLIATLARAVHFAHEQGVIHRDLKPSNILFDAHGEPHVADFGLAKREGKDESLTLTGDVFGAARYMAPEQATGQHNEISRATDVYGLGTTLYQALTGLAPFHDCPNVEVPGRVAKEDPYAVRQLAPNTPRDLETICHKCLKKAPACRYATALALAEDLDRFVAGEPILARPATRIERSVMWAKRKPAQAALVVVCFVAVASIALLTLWYARNIAQKATETVEVAELRTYATRIESAFQSVVGGDYSNASRLADQVNQEEGAKDWRGIEWRILQRWLHPELWEIEGKGISTAALSPDGALLALAVDAQWLELRDATTGAKVRELTQLQGGAGRAKWCFMPDSRHLALVAPEGVQDFQDFKVSLLTVPDGSAVWQVPGKYKNSKKDDPVSHRGIAVSPNGRWIAVSTERLPTTVHLASSGAKACPDLAFSVRLAFSPDSSLLVLAESFNPGGVSVYETGTWTLVERRIAPVPFWADFAFSPDGAMIAAGSPRDDCVRLRTVGSGWGEVLQPLRVGSTESVALAWAPEGDQLLVGTITENRSQFLSTLFEARSGGKLGETARHSRPCDWAAFLPGGQGFLTLSGARGPYPGNVKRWSRGAMVYPIHLPPRGPRHVETAVSKDGKHVFAAWSDGSVERWRLDESGAELEGFFPPLAKTISGFNVAPDGSRLAAAISDNVLHVWDLTRFFAGASPDACLEASLSDHRGKAWQPTFTPDGKYLACGEEAENVVLYRRSAEAGQAPWVLDERIGAPGQVGILAVSSDSRYLAASHYYAHWILVLDLKERSIRRCASRLGQNVESLAFSPGAEYLAAARNDGTIAVWIVTDIDPDGEEPPHLILERHDPSAASVTFSPDGSRLISGGYDHALRFWVVGDPRQVGGWPLVGVLRGLSFIPEALCFSRDSRFLVASGDWDDHSADGVHIFPVSPPPAELEPVDGLRKW